MPTIQNIRKLALKFTATGIAELISTPFQITQGSFGFINIQAFVPVLDNTTDSPLCSVYKTSINNQGRRVKSENNFNMLYKGLAKLDDDFDYMLFESPCPKEFTDEVGILQIVFNYGNTDGEGTALSILTSNIYETTVYEGGWNNAGVQLDITSQEAAQINQNTIDINNLKDTQDEFLGDAEELLNELTEKVDGIVTKQEVDNDFVTSIIHPIEQNSVVTQYDVKNISTQTTNTIITPIPKVDDENDGLATKDDHILLGNLNRRVATLENAGGGARRYAVSIPDNPTQQQLQELYETAAGVPAGTPPIDGTVLFDTIKNIEYEYFQTDSLFHLMSITTPQFTNESFGTILGSPIAGQVFAENDGRGSVNGWDTQNSRITNLENANRNFPTKSDIAMIPKYITGGTSTAYTITNTALGNVYQNGESFILIPHVSSTDINATLSINGLTPVGFVTNTGNTPINTNFLSSNEPTLITYDVVKNKWILEEVSDWRLFNSEQEYIDWCNSANYNPDEYVYYLNNQQFSPTPVEGTTVQQVIDLINQYAGGGITQDQAITLFNNLMSAYTPYIATAQYAEKFDNTTTASPVNGTNTTFVITQAKIVNVNSVRIKKANGTASLLWRGDDYSVDLVNNSITLIENVNNPIPVDGDTVGIDFDGRAL